jgi:phosphoglycolate phosphatase
MTSTIILDLDGPLLDGKVRHYTCYREILNKYNYRPLDLHRYWGIKRERVGLRQLLATSGAEVIYEDFLRSWLEMIERPDLLKLDKVQSGAAEKLRQWRAQGVQLVLATLRRHPKRLYDQLAYLDLDSLLNHIVVCEHSEGGRGKAQRVREIIRDISPERCLWVGDTEVDIEGARAFGCPIWAVTCGVRSESYLRLLSPDFLSPDLTAVCSLEGSS